MPTKNIVTILAIETSCDETSVAILKCSGGAQRPRLDVVSNIVSSQIKLHAPYGGVVPNLAKREHQKNLPRILKLALAKADIKNPKTELDAVAVTHGPGLEPALWAGITFAGEKAQEWNLPLMGINHMEGHLITPLLENKSSIAYPALALLVSGGHTSLVLAKKLGEYKTIGETVDDAAGEAFDKVARMMNLAYPGGPLISKLARTGNRYGFSFPRPMILQKNYNFSFSGLKTAVLYTLRDLKEQKKAYTNNDIAASFEEAVIDVLILKTQRAIQEFKVKTLIVGGGVAANSRLRLRLGNMVRALEPRPLFALPEIRYTGDNAAMIGGAAYIHFLKKDFSSPNTVRASWKTLKAHATLEL